MAGLQAEMGVGRLRRMTRSVGHLAEAGHLRDGITDRQPDVRPVDLPEQRRAILTHSPELHKSQAAGFDGTTLAKAGKKLDELAATLARGKTRRGKDKVEAEITGKPWVRRVTTWSAVSSA